VLNRIALLLLSILLQIAKESYVYTFELEGSSDTSLSRFFVGLSSGGEFGMEVSKQNIVGAGE
jgi:hypothetical protein